MTGQFILADVTSHRRGFGVQPIIDAAARRAETHQNVEKILWLVPKLSNDSLQDRSRY
jgi:hypothetical protein